MIEQTSDDIGAQLSTSSTPLDHWTQRITTVALIVAYLSVGLLILTFDTLVPLGDQVRFEVGDIPDEDIFAPDSRTYESTVLTEQARADAAAAVEIQYDRQSNVAREQLDLMRDIIDYMTMVQDDPYGTDQQKLRDLQAITVLEDVDDAIWEEVLSARSLRWNSITQELINALDRAMRLDIPPSDVDEVQQSLTVDPNLSDTDQQIVIEIVQELIVPNNTPNEEATELSRQAAVAAVQPRFRTFEEGETVITQGRRVTAVDIEALRQFGLIQAGSSDARIFLSAFLMLAVVSGAQVFYLARFYPGIFTSTRMMSVLAVMFLSFLAGARLFGPDFFDQQRLYPAAALGLLVTAMVGPHLATISVAGLGLLVGTMYVDSALEQVILITVGGMVGVWGLQDIERLNGYFMAGIFIGLANIVITLAFLFDSANDVDVVTAISDSLLAFVGGLVAAGVAVVGLFVVGALANLTTTVKLIELMQPNQPALKLMLRKAPGTYQHSLQVANLAELAAEQIGANATLVRVGAMYHDIGKTLNPQFFVENQTAGVNPHDELADPYRSAQLIIGHVAEGIRLARLHRLPERIRDFIREHHGTSKPMYFYYRALELADGDTDEIDIKAFTYPGPRPRTKETAILMLADGTESTARAVNPRTHEEIEDVVNKTFERALEDGQLDESNLTLNDLKAIREVFIETLQGIYHQRIAYTAPKVKAEATTTPQLEEGKETVEEEIDESPTVTDTNEIVVDDLELDTEVESDIEAIIKPEQPSTEKTSKEASPSKAKTRTQEVKPAQITQLEASHKSSSSTNAEASASEQDGEEANEDEDA